MTEVNASLLGDFAVGDPMLLTYTFESTTAPEAGSLSNSASFFALTNLTATVGSYNFSSSAANNIRVYNYADPHHDRYSLFVSDYSSAPDASGFPLTDFAISLYDYDRSVFSDALVLPTTLPLSEFESKEFILVFDGGPKNPLDVKGTITGFTVVPEPATMSLLGIGGLTLLRQKRNR